MQIKDILQKTMIDRRDAELIIAHVLGKPREFILVHGEQEIKETIKQKIKRLLDKRACGIPLAYLTGHKEFCGLDFIVNKHTLIPRPDTELIVNLVLKELRTKNSELRTTIVDVGTGSGCIPISILKNLDKTRTNELSFDERNSFSTHFVTPIKTHAIDISKPALSVARKNAKKHHTKIKFLHGNLFSPISYLLSSKTHNLKPKTHNFIITANLPYLTPQQFKKEPSIQHEPKSALVAGPDGLKYYRQLLKQIQRLTIDYRLLSIVYLEIDPSQTTSIKKLIKQHLPKSKIIIHKDLAGLNRVVEIVT